jgi:hypothetical protein
MKKMESIVGLRSFIDEDSGIGSCKNLRDLDSKLGKKTVNNSHATNE